MPALEPSRRVLTRQQPKGQVVVAVEDEGVVMKLVQARDTHEIPST